MADPITVAAPADDLWFAARMTNVQFAALNMRCSPRVLIPEMGSNLHRRRISRSASCDERRVVQWLRNGWNTERLLGNNRELLGDDALRYSLHWAFPQAYYAAYALTMAYFHAAGYTESSHTSVIRRVGTDIIAGKYPPTLSFAAVGAKPISFHALAPGKLPSTIHLDQSDPASVDAQIAQFLGATRRDDLKDKKRDMRLRTKSGKSVKKSLSRTDWTAVGAKVGPTSLLGLLYRKRIKANYRDIDSFLHPELNAAKLYEALARCVAALNFVHECFIAGAMGRAWYDATVASVGVDCAARRREAVMSLEA